MLLKMFVTFMNKTIDRQWIRLLNKGHIIKYTVAWKQLFRYFQDSVLIVELAPLLWYFNSGLLY